MSKQRPNIQFIPISTDPDKIKFFGQLMPSLLLLKASPLRFVQFQMAKNFTPPAEVRAYIHNESDDAREDRGYAGFCPSLELDLI